MSKKACNFEEEAFQTIIDNEWEVKLHISSPGGHIVLNMAIDQISFDYCGEKGICLEGEDNLIEIKDDGHLTISYAAEEEMYILENESLRCDILL